MAGDNKYYLRAGRHSTPMPESMVARLYEVRRTREQRIEAYLQDANFGIRPFDPETWLWMSAFAIPSVSMITLCSRPGSFSNPSEQYALVLASSDPP
jgi:hypothetical protein